MLVDYEDTIALLALRIVILDSYLKVSTCHSNIEMKITFTRLHIDLSMRKNSQFHGER